jgi:hypothetical protein
MNAALKKKLLDLLIAALMAALTTLLSTLLQGLMEVDFGSADNVAAGGVSAATYLKMALTRAS